MERRNFCTFSLREAVFVLGSRRCHDGDPCSDGDDLLGVGVLLREESRTLLSLGAPERDRDRL